MKKISINGIIGLDVTSSDIIKQIEAAGSEDKMFEIHSPGGSVAEGLAIYNAIKQSQGKSTMRVLGVAASMATVIAMAKGKPEVAKRSIFMIHNAMMVAMGDYRILQKAADLSNRTSDMLASIYAENSKKSKKSIREMMDNETYMFGEQIKTEGFAASVYDDGKEEKEEDAYAMAQLETEECNRKMQGYKEDFVMAAQILDCIQPPTPPEKPEPETNADNTANNPAGAGKNNNNGGVKMTLEELKAQHPALYQEVFNAGREAQKKESADITAKAGIYIKADSPYPASIKAIALEVIEGKATIESLQTTVKAFDAFKEQKASDDAKNEGGKDVNGGNTGTGQAPVNGDIKSQADLMAETKRTREMLGLEVN